MSGNFSEAEAHISTVLDDAASMELNTGGLAAQLTYLAWERGERGGTIDLLSDVVEAVPDRSDLHRAILADLLAADDRLEEASLELDRLALDDFSHIPRDRDWLPAMARIAHASARLEDVAEEAEDLGLQPLSERTAHLLRDPPSPVTVGPSFCREGDGWTVAYGTLPVHVPDSKGMRGLHHLLARPGVAVPATAIATEVVGDGVANSERARVNVTRQIRSAIDKIGEYLPDLAAHLTTAVLTGHECEYRPPAEPPGWHLGGC